MLTLSNTSIYKRDALWFGKSSWTPLLEHISLDVNPGEIVALVGQSGEGKTLLLQSILSLLPKNLKHHGEIYVDGKAFDYHQRKDLRGKTFYYVPQSVSSLDPLVKVQQHFLRSAALANQPCDQEILSTLMNNANLAQYVLQLFPEQLSGGMAKRILANTSILCRPAFILADEVTAWLDENLAHQLCQQFRGLTDQGCGILWVTHDLSLAAKYADKIYMLHAHGVYEGVSPEKLLHEQAPAQLQQLWDALPENWHAHEIDHDHIHHDHCDPHQNSSKQ